MTQRWIRRTNWIAKSLGEEDYMFLGLYRNQETHAIIPVYEIRSEVFPATALNQTAQTQQRVCLGAMQGSIQMLLDLENEGSQGKGEAFQYFDESCETDAFPGKTVKRVNFSDGLPHSYDYSYGQNNCLMYK